MTLKKRIWRELKEWLGSSNIYHRTEHASKCPKMKLDEDPGHNAILRNIRIYLLFSKKVVIHLRMNNMRIPAKCKFLMSVRFLFSFASSSVGLTTFLCFMTLMKLQELPIFVACKTPLYLTCQHICPGEELREMHLY